MSTWKDGLIDDLHHTHPADGAAIALLSVYRGHYISHGRGGAKHPLVTSPPVMSEEMPERWSKELLHCSPADSWADNRCDSGGSSVLQWLIVIVETQQRVCLMCVALFFVFFNYILNMRWFLNIKSLIPSFVVQIWPRWRAQTRSQGLC